MQIIPAHALYAPEEPAFGLASTGQHPFYSARLTVTFRDRAGRCLASLFDLDVARLAFNLDNVWRRVDGPVEVARDLLKVWDTAVRDSRPPVYGKSEFGRLAFDPATASPSTQVAVAAFITVLKNPRPGVSVAREEDVLRRKLQNEEHDESYIESAVAYAYDA